jgi:hypothetical protein
MNHLIIHPQEITIWHNFTDQFSLKCDAMITGKQ